MRLNKLILNQREMANAMMDLAAQIDQLGRDLLGSYSGGENAVKNVKENPALPTPGFVPELLEAQKHTAEALRLGLNRIRNIHAECFKSPPSEAPATARATWEAGEVRTGGALRA